MLIQVQKIAFIFIFLFSNNVLASVSCLSLLENSRSSLFDRPTSSELRQEQEIAKLLENEEARLVEPQEAEGIQRITNEILNIAGLEQDPVFVGIGRSPAPITAMMKAMELPNVYNLPLSAFRARSGLSRWRSIWGELILGSSYAHQLSEDEERALFEHFKRFLPTDEETVKNKKIYIIDLVITGTGLVAAADYIQRFYESLNLDVSVRPIAIRNQDFGMQHFVSELYFVDSVTYDWQDSAFGQRLHRQEYDLYSPYGQFSPRMNRWRTQPNPLYNRLIEELKSYLNP